MTPYKMRMFPMTAHRKFSRTSPTPRGSGRGDLNPQG